MSLPERNEKGQLMKGSTGNPLGRPKAKREYEDQLKLQGEDYLSDTWKWICEISAGRIKSTESLRKFAVKEYLDRQIGKPALNTDEQQQTNVLIEFTDIGQPPLVKPQLVINEDEDNESE